MGRGSRSSDRHLKVQRRRRLLQCVALLACLPAFGEVKAAAFEATIAAMRRARETEANVYYHYTEFSRRALEEGYRGIAYLFAAFAASEQVHAANFGRMLARLNAEVAPMPKLSVRVGSTRENLIRAADSEMASIETFYPQLLEQLQPEGHAEAIDLVRYAWSSEKQHRGKIRKIQRFTGAFFETVARTIDEKTDRYFVCGICGSTVDELPAARCPICRFPPTQYRKIEPPA